MADADTTAIPRRDRGFCTVVGRVDVFFRHLVDQIAGFSVIGIVHSGAEALEFVSRGHPHLVLLDFLLPDTTGVEVCRTLRSRGAVLDIIAVTSASDLATVKATLSYGVVQYLVKPLGAATLRDRLHRFATAHRQLATAPPHHLSQGEVDRALAALRPAVAPVADQPKGVSATTLDSVVAQLRAETVPASAEDIAAAIGVSRATARRYLEHLAVHRLATRTHRYGRSGRPGNPYRWQRSIGLPSAPIFTDPWVDNNWQDCYQCHGDAGSLPLPATGESMIDQSQLIINGELVAAGSGRTFENINPATEKVLGVAADAGPVDLDAAVAADSPFGGYKQSGLGRENGIPGFESFLEIKTIGYPPA
ncbi:aldehyde dehydrogenase family protein [Frankia tisae]|uniref:aldehyde dehydrogenase family protein n=1 Tax=Frankia tisae TaxID=2950104 RepID=UPI0027E2E06B|nr:aldehyde dehydrogenase family protein [Frankia tisae]